jgi:WXG100 family type VII secretion target
MVQAVVDPEKLRQFAADLRRFNDDLRNQMSRIQGSFGRLGETWRDQEHARFAQVFQQTMQTMHRFVQASQEHIPVLVRKAEKIEEYQRTR